MEGWVSAFRGHAAKIFAGLPAALAARQQDTNGRANQYRIKKCMNRGLQARRRTTIVVLEICGSGANFRKSLNDRIVILFNSCCERSLLDYRRNLALNVQSVQCKLAFANAMH